MSAQKRDLDLEQNRLKAIRNSEDPAQLAELEQIRNILNFWRHEKEEFSWNQYGECDNMLKKVMDRAMPFSGLSGLRMTE